MVLWLRMLLQLKLLLNWQVSVLLHLSMIHHLQLSMMQQLHLSACCCSYSNQCRLTIYRSWFHKRKQDEQELMFMKHYATNRCLYIKVAKLRTGVGSAEMSHIQNSSVKIFKNNVFINFHQLIYSSSSIS